MNYKLRALLVEKCKDYGLTAKAVEEIAESLSDGLTEETSSEIIEQKVNLGVLTAKMMQAEITRKAQVSNQKHQDEIKQLTEQLEKLKGVPTPTPAPTPKDEKPSWFAEYEKAQEERYNALRLENETFKAQKQKEERANTIVSKAKELGIPDFIMKHVNLCDDADIDVELNAIKQDLVNNQLGQGDGERRATEAENKNAVSAFLDMIN